MQRQEAYFETYRHKPASPIEVKKEENIDDFPSFPAFPGPLPAVTASLAPYENTNEAIFNTFKMAEPVTEAGKTNINIKQEPLEEDMHSTPKQQETRVVSKQPSPTKTPENNVLQLEKDWDDDGSSGSLEKLRDCAFIKDEASVPRSPYQSPTGPQYNMQPKMAEKRQHRSDLPETEDNEDVKPVIPTLLEEAQSSTGLGGAEVNTEEKNELKNNGLGSKDRRRQRNQPNCQGKRKQEFEVKPFDNSIPHLNQPGQKYKRFKRATYSCGYRTRRTNFCDNFFLVQKVKVKDAASQTEA